MIIHDYKLIFVHIPHTGGGSIQHALIDSLGDQGSYTMNTRHATLQQIIHTSNQDVSDYKVVTFVRDPWKRAVSGLINNPNHTSMESFLTEPPMPQIDYLSGCQPDFVGRFENIQHDFDYLCQDVLGIDKIKLPHHNKSDYEHKYFLEWLTGPTKLMIDDIYQPDTQSFNYEFSMFPEEADPTIYCCINGCGED